MLDINNKKIIKKNIEVNSKPSKWKRFKNNFWLKLNKNHSYNWKDRFVFALNFIFGFGGSWLSIYLAVRLTVAPNSNLNFSQWSSITIGAFLLVALNYLREHVNTWRTDKELQAEKTIYAIIGGAIEELNEFKCNPSNENPKYVYEILKYVEHAVFVVLKTYSITPNSLSANLMLVENDPLCLSLKFFGTKLAGRKRIKIPINLEDPLPGAPEAFVLNKMIYIDNTQNEKYKPYFDPTKDYRSIISIPIMDSATEKVYAVINIDSPEPNQFESKEFIEKKILPKIHTLILLFSLERNLFNLTNDINKNAFKESK